MKVHLIVRGIPLLYKALRKKKELDFEFMGMTLNDLVNSLGKKYGPAVKKALFAGLASSSLPEPRFLFPSQQLRDPLSAAAGHRS